MRDLTEKETQAIQDWHQQNDPDGDSFEFQDNQRWATVGHMDEELAYEEAERHGCCGSVNVTLLNGTFRYGFNYGH